MIPEKTTKALGIRVDNVSKLYYPAKQEPVEALRPVQLDIEPGAFVAIIGPSGCGKSTLLNLMAGFEKPTAGSLYAGDQRIVDPDPDRGMVFQQYALFPWLTVRENVAFGLRLAGVDLDERNARADEYLDLVGLKDFAQAMPSALSGGMKQRAALARAFCTDSSIILMDEPFGALDALTRGFLQQELLRIWQDNRKTVVLVTHSVEEALFLANRVIVMTHRPGRIKRDEPIELGYPRDPMSESFRKLEHSILSDLQEELHAAQGIVATGSTN
jgi:ABC-type nitrate/sulfonate/bicarbonate transport system ATPase subunit